MSAADMSAIHNVNRVGVGRHTPIEIQRKLELQTKLESKIQKLRSEYQQRLDEYEHIGAKLQHYAASVAPIQTTPDEILSEIFQHVFERDYTWGGTRWEVDLATLMLVCKYWREVAIHNPLLWNRIDFRMYKVPIKTYKQLDCINMLLERSKDTLLNIRISLIDEDSSQESMKEEINSLVKGHIYGSSHRGAREEMEEWIQRHIQSVPAPNRYPAITTQVLVRLIGPNGDNMSQWRSLRLTLDQKQPYYHLGLFKGPTPNLKSLQIELNPPYIGNETYRFFSFTRSVESLTLRCEISPSGLRLNPKLITSLDVYETSQWDTLISLPSFTNLKNLSYRTRYITCSHYPAEPPQLSKVEVYLPLLETLEFCGDHIPFIFGVFDVPKLSTLGIHVYIGSHYVRPSGRLFQYPLKIIIYWIPHHVVPKVDSVPLIKEFLMQCTSLAILDARAIDRSARASVLQAVEKCRALPQGLLNLQTVIFTNEVITFEPKTAPEFPTTTTSACPDPNLS